MRQSTLTALSEANGTARWSSGSTKVRLSRGVGREVGVCGFAASSLRVCVRVENWNLVFHDGRLDRIIDEHTRYMKETGCQIWNL